MKRIDTLKRLCMSLALAVTLVAAAASVAAADPALHVTTSIPDYVTPGRGISVIVSVQNVGDVPMSGDATVRYTFPVGVAVADPFEPFGRPAFPTPTCTQSGQEDDCVVDATGLPPGGQFRFKTAATVDPSASGALVGSIEVSGGGAPDDVTVPWTMIVGPIGPFAVKTFDVGTSDGASVPATQAGADPAELSTDIAFPTEATENLNLPSPNFLITATSESFKDVAVHVPPGLVGNPLATPIRCDPSQLTTPVAGTAIPQCPLESQIGVVQLTGGDIVPLYNVKPPTGSPAEFGFFYQSIVVTLRAKLRPSDNGIDIVTTDTPSSIPIPEFSVTLWGVPGESSHDPLRGVCVADGYGNNGGTHTNGNPCTLGTPTRDAFLRMPTSCTGPLDWGLDVNTYEHPDTTVSASTTTPGVTGCDLVPFRPSFSLAPTVSTAHSTTGLDATVSLPQDNGPDGVAQADLRTTTVTLPAGMTLNPSAADGLQACTDDQLNLGKEGVATCPLPSKIGTVTLRTPLLDHSVTGSVFLLTQKSDDPTSGQMFRIAVEIRSDDDGIDIKLPASISVNPASGQVTTTFDNLPQLPFSSLLLHFKDGPRAPLVTPPTCGDNQTTVSLTSWSNSLAMPPSSFATGGCAGAAFAPGFRAGVVNPIAGKSSPFNVKLTRGDGDQQFKSVTVYTPTGLLGRIASVVQCSDADANAGNCPSGTQIGTATVGAGVGSDPFYVTNGKVFLTGPFKGAPYGLSIVVHAVAGPFDLGNVVVRAAIHVDPRTAALSVSSDPFPTILKGIPLSIRDVRLSIDKPNFMVNPTSCATKKVSATVTSLEGWNAGVSSRFKVGECANLGFKPRMTLTVGGKGHLRSGQTTPLTARITMPSSGQANLKYVRVTLPGTINARLSVIQDACTLDQFEHDIAKCGHAKAGTAVAATPLLRDPLRGNVYFVKNGHAIPDLFVALRGPVSFDLVGRITIVKSKYLRTTFATAPDVPIRSFTLRLLGDSANGSVGLVANLCTAKAQRATAALDLIGQNGKAVSLHQRLAVKGCTRATRGKGASTRSGR